MSFQHIIQTSLNRGTANSWITTVLNISLTYCEINLTERLRHRNVLLIKIPYLSSISTTHKRIEYFLHQIELDNPFIGLFIVSNRVLSQSVQLRITLLSLLPTNEKQMRNVTIHERQEPIVLTCKRCQNVWEYHGNNPYVAKCSFCKTTVSVLKHKQKAAASGPSLAGSDQNAGITTPGKERR